MLEFIKEFLIEDALALIPVLIIIGAVLKSTPKIANWLIPYILLALGIVGGISLVGVTPEGVVQGILVAGVSVFTHQLVKNTTEGIEINKFKNIDAEKGNSDGSN